MQTNRKAITPIVASILLIVVAVILVTIVLNWGRDFSNKSLATVDTERLSKSNASEFVYTKAFSDGIIQFNYAPPDSLKDQEITITGYKIFFDNNETAEIVLDFNYTLSQGLNIIPLTSFSDQNVTSRKMDIQLKTSEGKYITLNSVTNNEPYVPEPEPQQYTAGPLSSGTIINDNTAGDFAWGNPNYAMFSDNSYTSRLTSSTGGIGVYDESVKIVKSNGLIGSINKAIVDIWPQSDANFIYGGEEDLWGEEWTAEEINDSNFGVVLQAELIAEGPSVITNYLKATNFNFNIPTNADINGIVVNIEKRYRFSYNGMCECFYVYAEIDYISMTVYYTN